MAQTRIAEIVRQIQSEYREMPGLRLTSAQVQRLWNLDTPSCDAVLEVLVDLGFLTRTWDGAFVRSAAAPPCATDCDRMAPGCRAPGV